MAEKPIKKTTNKKQVKKTTKGNKKTPVKKKVAKKYCEIEHQEIASGSTTKTIRKYFYFTKLLKQEWLVEYGKTYNVTTTCLKLDIPRRHLYKEFYKDPEFREAYNLMNLQAIDGIMSVLVEALHQNDWRIKLQAVKQLQSSKILNHTLSKYLADLSDKEMIRVIPTDDKNEIELD